MGTLLTDWYVGDKGRGREGAGGSARQLGEVAVWHEVLEGGGDADVVDPQESTSGKALLKAARGFDRDLVGFSRSLPREGCVSLAFA